MKTIRTYLSGCRFCNATGIVPPRMDSTTVTSECPVCKGTKVITVTEEFDQPVFFATIPPANGEVFATANGVDGMPYVAPENRRYQIMPNADGTYSGTIVLAPGQTIPVQTAKVNGCAEGERLENQGLKEKYGYAN